MNSFNKTDAAVFPFWLCFLGAFLFLSLIENGHELKSKLQPIHFASFDFKE